MSKKVISCAFLAFLVTLSIPPLIQAQSYETVKTITRSSDQTTDYFNVPTGEWRITWSYTPNPSYPTLAVFSVFAYPKGETVMYASSIMQIGDNNTSGVTYVHEGQGADYYLKIGAANIQSYTITIEKLADAAPSPSIPEYPAIVTVMALIIALGVVATVLFKKQAGTGKA